MGVEQNAPPQPDVRHVVATECAPRALPHVIGRREPRFQVVMRQSVLNEIHRHGQSVENTEICGVLVGNVYRDASGMPFLYVESSIRGEFASNQSCNVTFTAETWNYIQGIMEREHPTRRILGWYHTHPGFGIFLSDMDMFIHGNFFNLPWQVAFVYDPHSGEEGLFLWKDGATERDSYLMEPDEAAQQHAAHPNRLVQYPGTGGAARETSVWMPVIIAAIITLLVSVIGLLIYFG